MSDKKNIKTNNKQKESTIEEKKPTYVGGQEASEILGVHQRTLYQWDEKGWIETIRTNGNKRLYNVEKYKQDKQDEAERKKCEAEKKNCEELIKDISKIEGKLKIIYARVSSQGQKDDLERQKKILRTNYPNHILIEDIGSGINLNKRGIRKIIHLAISGKVEELVVTYKDRLARFGYELIEDIINEYSGGKIIVMNKKEEITPEEELAMDVLQIMNVFTAKMNGLRKYKNK